MSANGTYSGLDGGAVNGLYNGVNSGVGNGVVFNDRNLISNNLNKDGLVMYLDAGSRISYLGSGTVWTDLSGNGNNGTLTNGPTFNSGNGGSIVFDGIDDYVNSNNISNVQTLSYWIEPSVSNNLNLSSCLGETFYINGVLSESILGNELVTNGNFNSNTNSWAASGTTISWINGISGDGSIGYMRFNVNNNINYDRFFQTVNSVASKTYFISFWYRTSGVTGPFAIYLNSSNPSLSNNITCINIEPSTNWTYVSLIMATTSTLGFPVFSFAKIGSVGSGTFDIDAISMKEIITTSIIAGKWINITTTSSQPLYKSNNFGTTNTSSGGIFNGKISNVMKYNRALSAAEVLQNYLATKSRFNL